MRLAVPRPATLRQGGLSWSPPHHPLPDALYTDDPAEYSKYELGNRMGMTQTDANQLANMYGLTAQTLEVYNCTDLPGEDGNAWSAGASYGHRGCKAFFDLDVSTQPVDRIDAVKSRSGEPCALKSE